MVYSIEMLSNFIGILGVILVLVAFFLSQAGKVAVDSLNYLGSNLLGSSLITVSLVFHWNLSSFLIEMAWSAISIMGIIRVWLQNKARGKAEPV
ncbi:CBU_0592 family membrane protein [Legionella micdadei]|uniref:CBU-0592-like domain-containing protein n=1 Tax=Legionella micdadei TaxID=451 RepID=A0A098GAJ7_LEGMI|nr:hypothetical protein [Legionella micdadei]ARG96270.1 hypothetical protein B6N58_00395 [Legionella micdadei]ARG99025.1 hypothetical protein B6V88_00395 [Legionella micdadei]KTD29088.1 hypothetical protein Lmic_1008 [Legionella micdadei]NSL17298.1 hypothetical protein [Legionella micdadei]CEG59453.1 conserved exported protein of unknown function [Legionella micdadei]